MMRNGSNMDRAYISDDTCGFSRGGLDEAFSLLRRYAGSDPSVHGFPCAHACVTRKGRLVASLVCGDAPGIEDPIFDIASLTKVVATLPAVLMLISRGLIDLDDRIGKFFPSLCGHKAASISVAELLSHTSGLPDWVPLYAWPDDDPIAALPSVPMHTSSKRVVYACINFIFLGRVVELIVSEPLDVFTRNEIFLPLGMDSTSFLPLHEPLPDSLRRRIQPTEPRSASERGRELMECMERRGGPEFFARHVAGDIPLGIVHDENAAFSGGVLGNAGLFSSAPDLCRYGSLWLGRGTLDGKMFFSEETAASAVACHAPQEDNNRGLGWQLPSSGSSFGALLSGGSFGHTGFTGTGLWIDPERELCVVLLTNRVRFGRNNDTIFRLRPLFLDAVCGALERGPDEG
jgi:CubicO group peptidase (beta-lactamase class C family)